MIIKARRYKVLLKPFASASKDRCRRCQSHHCPLGSRINESDVTLAELQCLYHWFQRTPTPGASTVEADVLKSRLHSIIYKVIEDGRSHRDAWPRNLKKKLSVKQLSVREPLRYRSRNYRWIHGYQRWKVARDSKIPCYPWQCLSIWRTRKLETLQRRR